MKDYQKYKWFYTKSGKLVVGGKSAENNDKLLKEILEEGKELYVMHTSDPGSPFCVILDESPSKSDLDETAIFTGCFSKAWKEGKKNTQVDIFKTSSLSKPRGLKAGTWLVSKKSKKVKVSLELVLTKQNEVYRAVPEKSVNKKDILLKLKPGKILKEKQIDKILELLKEKPSKKDELLSALPAGGLSIEKFENDV